MTLSQPREAWARSPKLSSVTGQGHCSTFTVGGMLLLLILSYFHNLLCYRVYYIAS